MSKQLKEKTKRHDELTNYLLEKEKQYATSEITNYRIETIITNFFSVNSNSPIRFNKRLSSVAGYIANQTR